MGAYRLRTHDWPRWAQLWRPPTAPLGPARNPLCNPNPRRTCKVSAAKSTRKGLVLKQESFFSLYFSVTSSRPQPPCTRHVRWFRRPPRSACFLGPQVCGRTRPDPIHHHTPPSPRTRRSYTAPAPRPRPRVPSCLPATPTTESPRCRSGGPRFCTHSFEVFGRGARNRGMMTHESIVVHSSGVQEPPPPRLSPCWTCAAW